ncbi:hypothetical protein SK128_024820 [Halocaridina rubra]|uniref:R3H-associated N-terminal domain-containing protein n=1 Tax=Halocaridina rubra TaxID=373956 RepID=A0AAN8X0N5_HALRR
MGVIRKLRDKSAIISFSEESINSLGISQPSTPPAEPASGNVNADTPTQPVPERRIPGLLFERLEHHRPRTGVRKTRRANNTKALQTLLEDDFEETGEPSITDLQPKLDNAFTRLHDDVDDMRVWQYFISRSEEEQVDYLEAVTPQRSGINIGIGHGISFTQGKILSHNKDPEDAVDEDGFVLVPRMSDCREVHPANTSTPEYHFSVVEPYVRSALKKKNMPLGILYYLEEEILGTFNEDPTAIYISAELTSFERLILHGLCQYNRLKSKSTTVARARRTKVFNKSKCFHAPSMPLTQYLEEYQKKN